MRNGTTETFGGGGRKAHLWGLFVLGATTLVEIEVVGRLFLGELLLISSLPFLLLKSGRKLLIGQQCVTIVLAVLWLIGLVATDIYRDSAPEDYLRGWARVLVLAANFMALFLMFGNRLERVLAFAGGVGCGSIAAFAIAPSETALEYPWKFGIGYGLSLLAVVAISAHRHGRSGRVGAFVVSIVGVINVVMGSRGSGLSYILSGALILSRNLARRRKAALGKSKFLLISSIVAGAVVTLWLYGLAAESGIMGEKERLKYDYQGTRGAVGMLLAGRYELLGTLLAIADSPLLGHGSWAKDYGNYAAYAANTISSFDISLPWAVDTADIISTHSFILGAWVEAGILGVPFWAWALYISVRKLAFLHRTERDASPLIVVLIVGFVWSIFFSAFGATARISAALSLCAAVSGQTSGRGRGERF